MRCQHRALKRWSRGERIPRPKYRALLDLPSFRKWILSDFVYLFIFLLLWQKARGFVNGLLRFELPYFSTCSRCCCGSRATIRSTAKLSHRARLLLSISILGAVTPIYSTPIVALLVSSITCFDFSSSSISINCRYQKIHDAFPKFIPKIRILREFHSPKKGKHWKQRFHPFC